MMVLGSASAFDFCGRGIGRQRDCHLQLSHGVESGPGWDICCVGDQVVQTASGDFGRVFGGFL